MVAGGWRGHPSPAGMMGLPAPGGLERGMPCSAKAQAGMGAVPPGHRVSPHPLHPQPLSQIPEGLGAASEAADLLDGSRPPGGLHRPGWTHTSEACFPTGGSVCLPDKHEITRQDQPSQQHGPWFSVWPCASSVPSLGSFSFSIFKI